MLLSKYSSTRLALLHGLATKAYCFVFSVYLHDVYFRDLTSNPNRKLDQIWTCVPESSLKKGNNQKSVAKKKNIS